jgi:hypothetical protein
MTSQFWLKNIGCFQTTVIAHKHMLLAIIKFFTHVHDQCIANLMPGWCNGYFLSNFIIFKLLEFPLLGMFLGLLAVPLPIVGKKIHNIRCGPVWNFVGMNHAN